MIFLALWPPKSAHNIFWGIIKKKNLLKYLLLCKWQDSSLLNAGLTMYKMPPLNLRADCVLKDLKLNSVRSPAPFLWSDVEDFFAGFWQVGKGVLVIPPFITQLKRKCCCIASHTDVPGCWTSEIWSFVMCEVSGFPCQKQAILVAGMVGMH